MSVILSLSGISKSYQVGDGNLEILKNITFDVSQGDTISLTGTSGSGKSTLLSICAGLDEPTTGNISLCGVQLNDLTEDERADVRLRNVGFIFQSFELIPSLTAIENVMVPAELLAEAKAKSMAEEMLNRVGLSDRKDHYPAELSGGEQQRVAIARAFITKPKVLFADEPTGNLDEKTAAHIEALLFQLNEEEGATLILVTHDKNLASRTSRRLRLLNGEVVKEG